VKVEDPFTEEINTFIEESQGAHHDAKEEVPFDESETIARPEIE